MSVLPTGLFGSLLAVAGLLLAAQPVTASTEPIIEHLEFNEAAVLSYADAIVAAFSADTSATTEEPSFPETTLAKGTIEINELFIRHLPGSGFADVFISLMVVGELDDCPSSMSAFDQTTADPVVVDADGSATAVIDAAWTWTRQLNQGGVCFEKIVVDRWTETYTIDLTFSDGATSAEVAYGNQVESLGSAPPVDQPATPGTTGAAESVTTVATGGDAGSAPSDVGDEPADTSLAADNDADETAGAQGTETIPLEDRELLEEARGEGRRSFPFGIGGFLVLLGLLLGVAAVVEFVRRLLAETRPVAPWQPDAVLPSGTLIDVFHAGEWLEDGSHLVKPDLEDSLCLTPEDRDPGAMRTIQECTVLRIPARDGEVRSGFERVQFKDGTQCWVRKDQLRPYDSLTSTFRPSHQLVGTKKWHGLSREPVPAWTDGVSSTAPTHLFGGSQKVQLIRSEGDSTLVRISPKQQAWVKSEHVKSLPSQRGR